MAIKRDIGHLMTDGQARKLYPNMNNMVRSPDDKFTPGEYWEQAYRGDCVSAHILEHDTLEIAWAFYQEINDNGQTFLDRLGDCKSVIEVAAGYGDLSHILAQDYPGTYFVCTDLSSIVVERMAKEKPLPNLEWQSMDLFMVPHLAQFDMVLAFNVIEHFREPFKVLDMFLACAPLVLIEVPYKEENIHDIHPGAGWHCARFEDESFNNYNVIWQTKYSSPGWKKGKEWALLIGR